MSPEIPDDVRERGREAGIALRLELADIAIHEASSLWAKHGVIEVMNEAFARAIMDERVCATAAENERCAQIAEEEQVRREQLYETNFASINAHRAAAAESIASAIRSHPKKLPAGEAS